MRAGRKGRPAPAAALCLLAFALPLAAAAAQVAETPDALLARYRAQIEQVAPIRDVVFQDTERRTGPTRTIVEEHRVYRRADGAERNETIAVNGSAVVPAIVRFTTKAAWPYDVRAFALTSADYTARPIGAAVVDGRHAVGYSTVRTSAGDFAVTRLYLDAARALPLREAFTVSGGGCAGSGSIDFGPVSGAWLPLSARVSCTVAAATANGGTSRFKESIAFHDYAFPNALPPDVFRQSQ